MTGLFELTIVMVGVLVEFEFAFSPIDGDDVTIDPEFCVAGAVTTVMVELTVGAEGVDDTVIEDGVGDCWATEGDATLAPELPLDVLDAATIVSTG